MLPPNTPQFFFDDAWLADTRRVTRRWLPATVAPEPVITSDRPWEGPAVVLYGSVWPAPAGGWRIYYSNFVPSFAATTPWMRDLRAGTLLAESDDGLRWRKPELDQVPGTNFVIQRSLWDAPSVLFDLDDPAAPWKMIAFSGKDGSGWETGAWGMYAFTSADGLAWMPVGDGPVLVAGDRSNLLPERVNGEYWLYTRHRHMGTLAGCRAVYLSRSADFRTWSEPELVLRPDLTDEPDVQFYGMPVFRRHGWFIGLLEYWHDATDTLEVHLAISRDGVAWHRPAPHVPFIAPSYPWNRKWSTCASNGPIILNEQMVFYFGGRHTSHHYDTATLYGAIGFASLPADRFCALESGRYGGMATTIPLTWPGGDLSLNADTRASYDSHPAHCNGEILVDVLDAAGTPLHDWTGARFAGNTHCRGAVNPGIVTWDGRSLHALAGQTIRLRFHLNDARLFTFAACEV